METQNKGTAAYNDEIKLYDYWKIIEKEKWDSLTVLFIKEYYIL